MKSRIMLAAILFIGLCLCLGCMVSVKETHQAPAVVEKKVENMEEPVITVLNPLGTPPPIEKKQMAPRLDTLDGKTFYMINTGFPNSGRLLEVMSDWFKANYPKTEIVMARGSMTNIPENVMTEIKEKGDGVILGVGH